MIVEHYKIIYRILQTVEFTWDFDLLAHVFAFFFRGEVVSIASLAFVEELDTLVLPEPVEISGDRLRSGTFVDVESTNTGRICRRHKFEDG